ncbi:E3 ubiquitin-protein ligase HEL2 [Yarrowia sp. B02]|nr:E3 ubiquitin-protein ligase HEL2 [Yarrowia sp. B02]
MRVETGKLETKPKPTGVSSALQPGKKRSTRGGKSRPRREKEKEDKPNEEEEEDEEETKEEEDDDADICHICAEKVKFYAITQCNNVMCHKCPLRREALFGSRKCEFCRSEHDYVIIASTADKRFEEYSVLDLKASADEFHMKFESEAIKNDSLLLLQHKCPICKTQLNNAQHFKDHVRDSHHKQVCHLCFVHKKQFPIERRLYGTKQLTDHMQRGLAQEIGFSGHPECKFCHERFYDGDHLFKHMRDKHEKCHMCEKLNRGNADFQPRYFRNYDHLFEHFKGEHYVCTVQSCLDAKFVAFDNDIDLKAHQIEQHPNLYAGKASRNIDVAFEPVRGGSNRRRGFGGELSTISQPVPQQRNQPQQPQVVERTGPAFSATDFPALGGSSTGSSRSGSSTPATPAAPTSQQLQTRRLNERARNYLGYNMAKFEEFEEMTHKFLKYQIDGKKLVFGYVTLFQGTSTSDLGLLIEEVAGLMQNSGVKHKLRIAWEEHVKSKTAPTLRLVPKNKPMINSAWSASGSSSGRASGRMDTRSESAFPALGGSSAYPTLGGSSASSSRSGSASSSRASSSTNLAGRMNGLSISSSASSPSWGAPSQKTAKKIVRNDADFPALPKAPPKKYGRVNPVVPPGQWGASAIQSPYEEPENPNTLKTTKKGKKIVLDLGL